MYMYVLISHLATPDIVSWPNANYHCSLSLSPPPPPSILYSYIGFGYSSAHIATSRLAKFISLSKAGIMLLKQRMR